MDQVLLAAMGIVLASVTILSWIVRFLMVQMKDSLDANAKAHLKVAKSNDKNTEVSQETLKFLRALNGKVAKAAVQTIAEQRVEHQVVKSQEPLK